MAEIEYCEICGADLRTEYLPKECFICGRILCKRHVVQFDMDTLKIGECGEYTCENCIDQGKKYIAQIKHARKRKTGNVDEMVEEIMNRWRTAISLSTKIY